MRSIIIPISKAKTNLLKLTRQLDEEGRSFIFTKDGVPICALISIDDYASFEETFDILSNPTLVRKIQRALAQEKRGKLWTRTSSGKWVRTEPRRLASH